MILDFVTLKLNVFHNLCPGIISYNSTCKYLSDGGKLKGSCWQINLGDLFPCTNLGRQRYPIPVLWWEVIDFE